MSSVFTQHPSSYRDPSGFMFLHDGIYYRQVNTIFKTDFDLFTGSGCYDNLVKKGWLIPHQEINQNLTGSPDCYITLKPEQVRFISYPYEWSFDMLKDAALLTLRLAKEVTGYGLLLKDATPYNIQWHGGKLVFIDTLSFEKYNEDQPWIAYRQFCETFLGPLLLMHYSKMPLHQLQLAYPEGIPLEIISSLLPARSKFSFHTYLHIHLHARLSAKNKSNDPRAAKFSRQKLLNLFSSLEILVNRLQLPGEKSTWSAYYEEAAQRKDYLEQKKEIIRQWLGRLDSPGTALDLGANDGEFSKLLAQHNIYTLASDFDPLCINNLYKDIKQSGELNIQPLLLDLSNPAPATGVNNSERMSFTSRGKADLALALALVHHLAIGKNIPFDKIAGLFAQLTHYLVIEFIPKEDEKIQFMLKNKRDIYTEYTEENFVSSFSKYFTIVDKKLVGGSSRVLYLMKKHA